MERDAPELAQDVLAFTISAFTVEWEYYTAREGGYYVYARSVSGVEVFSIQVDKGGYYVLSV